MQQSRETKRVALRESKRNENKFRDFFSKIDASVGSRGENVPKTHARQEISSGKRQCDFS